MIFTAEMLSDDFKTTAESSEVKLFHQSEIPWEHIAFSSNTFALDGYFSDLETGSKTVHFGTFKKSKSTK
jgi:hypothetical protein